MKRLFYIAPFGVENSDIRKHTDQIYRYIIEPVANELGYQSIRPDSISTPGIIQSQIIKHLIEDELVVADLTGNNPNVFYELGIRHALNKPAIQLCSDTSMLPFDLASFRTIVVNFRDLDSVFSAKESLIQAIKGIEEHPYEFSSPFSVVNNQLMGKGKIEVPINIYSSIDNKEKTDEISKAVKLLAKILELNIDEDPPAESGSWIKRFLTSTKESLSEPEVQERLNKVEKALELQALNKPISEIDKNQAEAISAVIKSIENVESAVLRIGSLIILKQTIDGNPKIFARTLTVKELQFIDKHPEMLSKPDSIMALLDIE